MGENQMNLLNLNFPKNARNSHELLLRFFEKFIFQNLSFGYFYPSMHKVSPSYSGDFARLEHLTPSQIARGLSASVAKFPIRGKIPLNLNGLIIL